MRLLAATREGGCDPTDDSSFGVPFSHAHVEPAELSQCFMPSDVFVEHVRVGPVVISLVLSRDLDVFPTHIQFGDQRTVFVVDGYLRCRARESVPNEKQA